MPEYRIQARDANNNKLGEFDDFYNLKYSKFLNEVGECSFEVPYKDTKLSDLLDFRKNSIHIYRDNVRQWAGEQVLAEGSLKPSTDNFVRVLSKTWLEQLNQRFTGANAIYNQENISYIIKSLLDYTQGLTDGNFGFTLGSNLSSSSEGWYQESFGRRIKITIPSAKVDADLTDFPVYIDMSLLPSDFWSNAQTGLDVAFTADDGITKLDAYMVSIDTTNELGDVYVKVPTLNSSSNTSIYLYYDNSSYTITQDVDTFSNAFTAYYPMTVKTNDTVAELTENIALGTKKGYCLDFDGSGDYVNFSSTGISTSSSWSVAAWVYPRSKSSLQVIGAVGYCSLKITAAGNWQIRYDNAGARTAFYPVGDLNRWYHVVAVFERSGGAGGTLKLYVDGELVHSDSFGVNPSANRPNYLGQNGSGVDYYNGRLADFRFHSKAFNSDEVLALYRGEPFLRGDTLVFEDSFTEATTDTTLASHTPGTGTSWTKAITVGTASMHVDEASDTLKRETGSLNDGVLYTADASYTNSGMVEVGVVSATSGGGDDYAYLIAQYIDSNNYYALEFTADSLSIYKKVAGTWTQLYTKSETGIIEDGDTIRFESRGGYLKVFINGILIKSVLESSLASSGKFGIGLGALRDSSADVSSSWEFDNFKAYTITSNTLDDNQLLYFPFYENTGSTLHDVASSNNGTITNAVWKDYGDLNPNGDEAVPVVPNYETPNGKMYYAIPFDGYKDYIDLPYTVLEGEEDLTVSFWFKTLDTTKGIHTWISGATASDRNKFNVRHETGSIDEVRINDDGDVLRWSEPASIYDGEWHHYAFTRDISTGTWEFFFDGVSQGTDSDSGSLAAVDLDSGGLVIGQEQDSVGGSFDIDQAMVGFFEHLTFASGIRADEWIAAEFENQNNPADFLSFGSEETQSATQFAKTITKAYENKNIMDALIELANMDGGPDIEITDDKVINLYVQMGSDLTSGNNKVRVEWGHNMASVDKIAYDFSNPVNQALVSGSGFGSAQEKTTVTDATARTAYKLRQGKVVSSDEREASNLTDKGQAVVDLRKDPLKVAGFTFMPEFTPGFGDFSLGDRFPVIIKDGYWNIELTYVVTGWEVTYNEGVENIEFSIAVLP